MVQAEQSSDEEMDTKPSSLEAAALARKKRLLEMKSRLHGIEMREEDYEEEAEKTKKSQTEATFRSYKPLSEVPGKVAHTIPKFDVVEEDAKSVKPVETVDLSTLAPKKIDWDLKRDIEKRLQKLERRTQKCIAELIRKRLAEGKGDLASTVNAGPMDNCAYLLMSDYGMFCQYVIHGENDTTE
ncbi:Cwf18 pre-mRNA splicing factor [Dictyocaulus viviparus]|uniref:Cwf18 pre-mRNA splicing factor n=1 Tax=Dictyocaulus viviparus TaxID=29172 RepID=A0A0D8XVS8_DICVI|nr:Cwf18 pre-mRNA splicing factor [Dictyocaulus viviparus]